MVWYHDGEEIEESDIYDIVDEEYTDDDYEQLLTDCYGTLEVGEFEWDAGEVLRAMDEVAFECGRSEEVDRITCEIIDSKGASWGNFFGFEWIEPDDEDDE